MHSPPGTVVVLVEGCSDRSALRVLARRRGLTAGVDLRAMGGATNVRRHLHDAVTDAGTHRVLGLCDAGEASFFVRALASEGAPVTTEADLAAHGFHTCARDLEDELIRALGTERVRGVLEGLDLERAFDRFSRQPAWSGRPLPERLHRFPGVVSGRKSLFAEGLAAALYDDELPDPLRRLLDHVETALAVPAGPPLAAFGRVQRAASSGTTSPDEGCPDGSDALVGP